VPGAHGIFVLSEIGGVLGERIRDVQRRFDPKLARETPPHVTLAGSSGVGPIVPSTPVERIREALAPIAASTPPLELPFEPPHRFMATNIVVLPLDPHGPLRRLHDRIARSGLTFARAKFTFTPHVTLSFYPTLPRDAFRELLAIRFDEPARLDRMTVYYTRDPQPAVKLLDLPFAADTSVAVPSIQGGLPPLRP
jgi:2'-5' RNA ligase